jgi:hypothetical protein
MTDKGAALMASSVILDYLAGLIRASPRWTRPGA